MCYTKIYLKERSILIMKQCPYCGTVLKEYFIYENGEAKYIETETYCHECKRRISLCPDIRKVEE